LVPIEYNLDGCHLTSPSIESTETGKKERKKEEMRKNNKENKVMKKNKKQKMVKEK
jgi:hypothetical protein